MKVIAILYGGRTGEHEVSCRSAASVVEQIDRSRYTPLLIGIDADGVWYLQETTVVEGSGANSYLAVVRNPDNLVHAVPGKGLATPSGPIEVDFVFPVLHGTFGEDGTIQGLLEVVDLPYAGADVIGSAVGMDKIVAKRLWEQAGLLVVPFIEVTRHQLDEGDLTYEKLSAQIEATLKYPVFVKPVTSGSSVGVSKVEAQEKLAEAVELALRFDTRVLVEQQVLGKEVECSVIGNHRPEVFTPGEIVPTHSFYDYEAKYIDPDGAQLLIPAHLSQEKIEEVRDIALRAYSECRTSGMARIDFLIDGSTEKVYLNEINTIPGFTNISMFARMCGVDGLSYPELLSRIIELGMDRFSERRGLEYALPSSK